jgi:hypothetical protein
VCVFITAAPITMLSCSHGGGGGQWRRERVLFIGSQYSNLYTAVDTPAEAAWDMCNESQPKPRGTCTTTSRGLCGLVCPSRTSERGGEDIVWKKEGEKKGSVRGSVQGAGRCDYTTGTREEPGTFTQGGALFSLVPLVWESNPKLQVGWCKTQPPVHRGI